MTKQKLTIGLVIMTAMAGVCVPLTKGAFDNVPPIFFLTLRFGVAFLIVLLWRREKFFKGINRRNINKLVLISLFMTGGFIVFNSAMFLTTVTNSTFCYSISVIMIPFIAKAVNGTEYTKQLLAGIAVTLLGLFGLLSNTGQLVVSPGDLMGLLSALLFSLQIVLTGRYVRDIDSVVLAGFQFGFTAVATLGVAWIFEDIPLLQELSLQNWLAVLSTGVVATFGMFIAQNFAQKKLSESITGIIIAIMPLFTAVSSWILLGETLSLVGKLGAGLMIGGAVFASVDNKAYIGGGKPRKQ